MSEPAKSHPDHDNAFFENIGNIISGIGNGVKTTLRTPHGQAIGTTLELVGAAAGAAGAGANSTQSIPEEVAKFIASEAGAAALIAGGAIAFAQLPEGALLLAGAVMSVNPVVGLAVVASATIAGLFTGAVIGTHTYKYFADLASSAAAKSLGEALGLPGYPPAPSDPKDPLNPTHPTHPHQPPGPGTPVKPGSPKDPRDEDDPNTPGPGRGNPWPGIPPIRPKDPLVLDLDGDGIELVSADKSGVHFDFESDGFAEKTGWLRPDDAFLIHDDNGNGRVDGPSELFGNTQQDGFSALAVFDTNKDGKVDADDKDFAKIALWRDLNQNGVFDEGERFSLSEYSIESISLDAKSGTRLVDGNQIASTGNYTKSDGTQGGVAAVLFGTNKTISIWTPPEGFVVSKEARRLPNLKGYGLLPDLLYSMSLDDKLRSSVSDFLQEFWNLPIKDVRAGFESLLLRWAGVEDVDVDSRGGHVDGRIVAFVEHYFGSEIVDRSDGFISENYGAGIRASFNTIAKVLLTRFMSQSFDAAIRNGMDLGNVLSSPYLIANTLNYDLASDRYLADISNIFALIAVSDHKDDHSSLAFYMKIDVMLSGLKYEYFHNDENEYKNYLIGKIKENLGGRTGLIEAIKSGLSSNVIFGTSAPDNISGSAWADTVAGGKGDDILKGGDGDDTYFYARGDGNDTIIEEMNHGNNDRLIFEDINASDVTLLRDGNDVTIVIAETAPGANDGGSVLLKDSLNGYYGRGTDKIVFADGTVWTQADMRKMLLAQAATDGNDRITGFYNDDVIRGGKGDDILKGGDGDDIYFYARGDGNDTIIEEMNHGNNDRLIFEDINASDVTLLRDGNDVTIVIAETAPGANDGGSVLLKDNFSDYYGRGIEKILFADGVEWTRDPLRQKANVVEILHHDRMTEGFADNAADSYQAETIKLNELQRSLSPYSGMAAQPNEPILWKTEEERQAEQSFDERGAFSAEATEADIETSPAKFLDLREAGWNEFRAWQDGARNMEAVSGDQLSIEQASMRLTDLMPSRESGRNFAELSEFAANNQQGMMDGTRSFSADATLVYRSSLSA
ncbi:hemolysin type calcium binding protein [Ochrobactrum sp. BH3]|nr:hemolysin type calcium binding protein [Ochrobactrum sp. BH3]